MSETQALAGDPAIVAATSVRRPVRAFLVHLGEMALAMTVGMFLFDPPLQLLVEGIGSASLADRADVAAGTMATSMAAGMALWMAYRRHQRAAIVEMSLAMYVAYIGPLAAYWAGAMSGDAALGAGHLLMVPATVAAMLRRREEYTHGHRHRRGRTTVHR